MVEDKINTYLKQKYAGEGARLEGGELYSFILHNFFVNIQKSRGTKDKLITEYLKNEIIKKP